MLRKIIAYVTILDGENEYEETRPCERTSPITSESEGEDVSIPTPPPPPPSIRDIIMQANTEETKPSTSGLHNVNEGASTSGLQPAVDEESTTPTTTAIHSMQPRVLLHDFNQLVLNDAAANDSDETQYDSVDDDIPVSQVRNYEKRYYPESDDESVENDNINDANYDPRWYRPASPSVFAASRTTRSMNIPAEPEQRAQTPTLPYNEPQEVNQHNEQEMEVSDNERGEELEIDDEEEPENGQRFEYELFDDENDVQPEQQNRINSPEEVYDWFDKNKVIEDVVDREVSEEEGQHQAEIFSRCCCCFKEFFIVPWVLTSCKHMLCFVCFTKRIFENDGTCPICRKAMDVTKCIRV